MLMETIYIGILFLQSECIFDHRDVPKVDCIGRFETINEGFKALSLQLFGDDKLLPHVNKSPSKKVLNLFNRNKVDYQSAYAIKGLSLLRGSLIAI
ncbi:hypothetical protein CKO50_02885 [Pseudoalteromonas sp. HM-SA03]|nr:hypothetical protein CKO50_02885 [Pseudoalteromonas sp. HM-SA03]